VKYDDASWHYGADHFPKDQPEEHGATHIGLFLKWCFVKGWAGQLHTEGEPEAVVEVVNGTRSGTKFLLEFCDGKFTNEDLTPEGNAFAEQYYGENGLYLEDYISHFGSYEYRSPESAHDFLQFSTILEERMRSNVLTKSQVRPWWKFW